MVYPRESSHFRFYSHNSYSHIPELHRSETYQRDTLGLRHLKETGRLEMVDLPGGHLEITEEAARDSIAPHLTATAADIRIEAHEEASNETLYHHRRSDAPVSQFVSPYHSYARREYRYSMGREANRKDQQKVWWYNALPGLNLPRIPAALVSLMLMLSLWFTTTTATAGSLPLASLLHGVSVSVLQESREAKVFVMASHVQGAGGLQEKDGDMFVDTDSSASSDMRGRARTRGAEQSQWFVSNGLQPPLCRDRQPGRKSQQLYALQQPVAPPTAHAALRKPRALQLAGALPSAHRGAVRLHVHRQGGFSSAAVRASRSVVGAFV